MKRFKETYKVVGYDGREMYQVLKRFFAGGEEYRIIQHTGGNGLFEIQQWEESNYYDGEWIMTHQEESEEAIYCQYVEILNSTIDYDMNI